MKTKITTLTIGIAAYNEEKNIPLLLEDIRRQELKEVHLKELIVVSDASTDSTDAAAQNVQGLPVHVQRNVKRIGLGASLNTVFDKAKTDVVITFDADIRLPDTQFITKLIEPIIKNHAEYTSSSIGEIATDSFFTHALTLSMQVKRKMYRLIHNGNNIYTSFGLARGYAKKLYQVLRYPTSIGNDMYVYLYCVAGNYRFVHVPTAIAKYYLPRTLQEHISQSTRFFHARAHMTEFFDTRVVADAFRIPFRIYVKGLFDSVKLLIKNPIHAAMYVLYLAISYVHSKITQTHNTWSISKTTKGEARGAGRPFRLSSVRTLINIMLGYVQKLFGVVPMKLYILCYHGIGESDNYFNVSQDQFDKQMAYLNEHATFVSLDQIQNFLITGAKLPSPAVAVTFDDGYKSILKIRATIKKYDIRPTVFVLSNPENAHRVELDNKETFLSVADLRDLQKNGWTVGSHTATHTHLKKLTPVQLKQEILGSKHALEKVFDTPVTAIAYPKGVYTDTIVHMVKDAGYTLGLSMNDGPIDQQSTPHVLPRIGINTTHTLAEFRTLALPINSFVRKIAKQII